MKESREEFINALQSGEAAGIEEAKEYMEEQNTGKSVTADTEEEKTASLLQKKITAQIAVREFINSRPEVRRLLVVNGDWKNASESELNYADSLSYEEMLDAGYIIFDIDPEKINNKKDSVRCLLSVGVFENSVDFTVICNYDNWLLDNYKSRPVELQSLIYDYFAGKEGIFSAKLDYLSCSSQVISDDAGAMMSIYNEHRSLFSFNDEDKPEKAFPLEPYTEIISTVVDRLINHTNVRQYLSLDEPETKTAESLIADGYIRLVQRITADDNTPDQYLVITLEDSLGLQLSFDVFSKKAAAFMPDGTDKVKNILKCIKEAMRMIPGVKQKSSQSSNELNNEWSFSTIPFGIEYTEETVNHVIPEEDRKQVMPRFFANIETINQVLDLDMTEEEFETDSIQELRIDIIDYPFYMCLTRTEDGKELTFYERNEFCVSCELEGKVKGNITVSKPKGARGTASDEAIGENLGAFFKASMLISKYFLQSGLKESIGLMDFDREGFSLSVSDAAIQFPVVSGRKRPDMICSGGILNPEKTIKMRPYIDEVTGSMMHELGGEEALLDLAEHNDETAMLSLAELYAKGDENTAVDPAKAFYWYEKLAVLDHPTAQYNLAQFYFQGFGTERDFDKAVYWMNEAEKNGDEDAPERLTVYEKAAANEKAALGGDAQAEADYARLLMQLGSVTEEPEKSRNFEECVKWAQKAADQGNSDGIWILALAYDHGRGLEEDKEKAIGLYQKGASLGHAPSMNSIGCYCLRGELEGKTAEEGFELIKGAAEKGDVDAMRNLGHCYQFDEGTKHDMGKAVFWYERYLEHREDEELASKVMIFKMLPDFEEDSLDEDDEYKKVDPEYFAKNIEKLEFTDKVFVLTGFDSIEERKIKGIITDRGGIVASSTVLKTNYLVVNGDYSSRKYERAVELKNKGKNIQIISKKQFYDLLA